VRRWAALALAGALAAGAARGDERIRVALPDGKIAELPLEQYVAGVVAGEMPPDFPPEAMKAQAVAARTYALVRKIDAEAKGKSRHVGASVLHQVFVRTDPGPAARAAAEATKGEVLVRGVEPVEAYFHSACGGTTERGADALGRDLDYLAAVPCGRCEGAPRVRWSVTIAAADLGRAAGLGRPATSARVAERTSTGRAARVEIEAGGRKVVLAGADLRQRLGWTRLPSLAFELREAEGAFVFDGRGAGHGAGLCQWGAAGFAREGKTYAEILAHYYPGTELRRLY
jgi:stage II sporulation protein D